jgi:hypothetical protein
MDLCIGEALDGVRFSIAFVVISDEQTLAERFRAASRTPRTSKCARFARSVSRR